MPVQYPGIIPDLLTRFGINPLDFTSYNDLLRELQALFNANGVNPQGGSADIATRVAAIETQLGSGALAVITNDSSAIVNTTTETMFGNGFYTVQGNSATVARTFRITAGGVVSTKASAPGTLKLRMRWGNAVADPLILDMGTGGSSITAGLSNAGWCLNALLTVRSIGITGTIVGTGVGETDPLSLTLSNFVPGPVSINTTVTRLLSLLAQWSLADVANTITLKSFVITQLA